MLRATLGAGDRPLRKVLALGAHADDIEIGCGGTVLRLVEERPGIEFLWVVLSGNPERAAEARRSAAAYLGKSHRPAGVRTETFRDGHFPWAGPELKAFFETTLKPFDPDLILTHTRGDLHQDHRTVCELTWNTFRDHLILEYEVPKYDGDLHTPGVYVALSESHARRKADLLMEHFGTQTGRHWFAPETFLGLMRIRGVEARSPSGYAEGFHGRKVVL